MTPSVIDIVYAKAKPKGERRLDFTHWLYALDLLAAEKYPGDPYGPQRIRELIVQNPGPTATATVTASGGICKCTPVRCSASEFHSHVGNALLWNSVLVSALADAKLTDSRLYTGSHRHRFDESGHGKGAEGRDVPVLGGGTVVAYHGGAVADLSQITREGMRGGTLLSSASVARRETAGLASPARSPKRPASSASPAGGFRNTMSPSQHAMAGEAASVIATSRVAADDATLFQMFLTFCVFGCTSGNIEEVRGDD